jgi:hypothetical protein
VDVDEANTARRAGQPNAVVRVFAGARLEWVVAGVVTAHGNNGDPQQGKGQESDGAEP